MTLDSEGCQIGGRTYQVRHLNPSEHEAYWAYERQAYADTDVIAGEGGEFHAATLWRWFADYPRGLFVLADGGTICGALGIWPLAEASYTAFTRGTLAEHDLPALPLEATPAERPCASWYVSGISIRSDLRRTGVSVAFSLLALRQWASTGDVRYPVHICAVAATPGGVRWLQRLHFALRADGQSMLDHWPLYILTSPCPADMLRPLEEDLAAHS